MAGLGKQKALGVTSSGIKTLADPINLSHYTTLSGLKGIIEAGQIWASNVSFLNDRRELVHGIEASVKAIKRFAKESSYQNWYDLFKSASADVLAGRIPNTYAACFCGRSDILSQWRGYGGSEQGVAIAFDKKQLKKMLAKQKAYLCEVKYGNLSAAAKMSDGLKHEIDAFEALEELVGASTEDQMSAEAYSILCRLIPQFKRLGFADEREWRFVIQQEALGEDVCFRVCRNVIVPYIPLGPGAGGKLPIDHIVVGPGADQELTKRSIEIFLGQRGYNSVSVHLSSVPFRA